MFKILVHVLSQIVDNVLILHPSSSDSTGFLLSTAVCSELQCWFTKFYTVIVLPILDHSCLLAAAPIVPGVVTLIVNTVPPFHSSVYKSVKHFGHSFVFDARKIWNKLPDYVSCAIYIASFRKKLKTYLFAKSICHSIPVTPVSWYDLAMSWLNDNHLVVLCSVAPLESDS